MENLVVKGVTLLVAGLLSGCATPVYEGRFSWEAGWREGAVEAIGEDERLRLRYAHACKREAAQDSTARFARIRYKEISRTKWQVVIVPKDSALKVGDLVYVKVLDCAGQAVPRTAQKKSAAAQEKENTAARHA